MKSYIIVGVLGVLAAVSVAFFAQAALPCADFNGDNVVDSSDVAIAKANSGMAAPTFNDGDVDGDGDVDSSDIAITKSQLGNGCSSGSSHHSSHHGSQVIKAPPANWGQINSTAVVSTSTGQVLGVMLSDLPPTGADELIKAGRDN